MSDNNTRSCVHFDRRPPPRALSDTWRCYCAVVLLVGAVFDLLAVVRRLEGVTVMSGRGYLPPFVAVRHDEGPPQAKPIPCARVVSSSAATSPRGERKWEWGRGVERSCMVYVVYMHCVFSVLAPVCGALNTFPPKERPGRTDYGCGTFPVLLCRPPPFVRRSL